MHSDVAARLRDAVNDAHRGSSNYGYYIDHSGDGDSGDCIYSCNGDIRKAPYEISSVGGKATAHIDMDNSTNVVPRTVYEEEADDDDQYAAMEESFKRDGLYTSLPLYERFISKKERDAASEDDFAGKGKSFPILQPGDVQAAVHAMGRAGDKNVGSSTLKSRIIAIAKRKGWTKYLPKSWQGDGAKESAKPNEDGGSLKLFESAATLETINLTEAKADYEIKLIAPGKGSSAFYPAEVLKRDGPKVFTAGTHVYLNHPTAAEEAARPEGDVKNLAGVLASNAVYHESHAKGPGLYARMKVFQDHAQTVEEKAPHVGMSIRASGVAESGKKQDGLPVLKQLTGAESVDVVTRAGAGGMILTESAKPNNSQEVEMTVEEAQKLIQEGIAKATAPLLERAIKGDAREECTKILEAVTLPAPAKSRVIERCLASVPTKEGALDVEKLREAVVREAKAEGQYLGAILGSGQVRGLGDSASPLFSTELTEAQIKERRKEEKRMREADQEFLVKESQIFSSITGLPIKEAA